MHSTQTLFKQGVEQSYWILDDDFKAKEKEWFGSRLQETWLSGPA